MLTVLGLLIAVCLFGSVFVVDIVSLSSF
jgi:hypothetical protein